MNVVISMSVARARSDTEIIPAHVQKINHYNGANGGELDLGEGRETRA